MHDKNEGIKLYLQKWLQKQQFVMHILHEKKRKMIEKKKRKKKVSLRNGPSNNRCCAYA